MIRGTGPRWESPPLPALEWALFPRTDVESCPGAVMSFLDSRTHAAPQGIGQPVLRAEDRRLITGRGRYSDDVTLPRQVYAAFLRSPHAHARIRSIDVRSAAALPGVLAVFTGTDAAELA